MQASLIFLLSFATFGDCKKSHKAKHEGYLVHTKSHKKGTVTYLKINKSHGKSKHHYWTAHENQPKGQGLDYRDIDNDKWVAKEKKWMDKWDEIWDELYANAEEENSKPKPEAAEDPNTNSHTMSQDRLGWKTWVPLMDALRNKTKAKIEEEKIKNKTLDYMRLFIHNDYRRRVKWVQSTEDTQEIFLTHTFYKNFHQSMDEVRKKGGIKKLPPHTTTPIPAPSPPPGSWWQAPAGTSLWPTVDERERHFVNTYLDKDLKTWRPRTWEPISSKKKALHRDYGGVQEDYGWCSETTTR